MAAVQASSAVQDMLEGGARIAATVLRPELIPLVSPVFKIAKGSLGLLAAIFSEPDRMIEMLEAIQQVVTHLADQSKQLAPGLGQLVRGVEPYQKINNYVRLYIQSPHDKNVAENISDQRDGLSHHLQVLQDMIMKAMPVNPDTQPWIIYLCDHCQSNSPDTDATWGFDAASKRFAAVLALQRMAVVILKDSPVGDFVANMDEQVDLFLAEFERRWNGDVGKVKLAKKVPCQGSVCFGDISDNHFYRVVAADDSKESALEVIDLSEKSSRVKTLDTHELQTYKDKYRMVVHDKKVYTVDQSQLRRIDLTTREMDTICAHKRFHWKSQMVCHDGFLYAVSKKGELCRIGLKDEYLEAISSVGQWSTSMFNSTALTVIPGDDPLIYAIAEGGAQNSFYSIDPSIIDSKNEKRSGCYFTSMALVGHGKHLYAVDDRKIYAYDPNEDSSYVMITSHEDYERFFGGNRSVHLLQQGLTLYLQVNTSDSMELYLVKPYFY